MSSPTWLICNLDHVIGSLLDETVLPTLMLQRSFTKWLQRFLWGHSSDPSAGVSIARHVSFWWHSLTSQPRLTKSYSRACLPPKSNWPSGKVCWLYKCSSVVNGQRATMKAGTQERAIMFLNHKNLPSFCLWYSHPLYQHLESIWHHPVCHFLLQSEGIQPAENKAVC